MIGDSSTQEEALWESFLYAFSLCWSRAHERSNGPELILLVDLFNGNSARVNRTEKNKLIDPTVINVDIASGKWPSLPGDKFRDDCNLSCLTMHDTRDLGAGEVMRIYGQ